jgi:hypothetical protein
MQCYWLLDITANQPVLRKQRSKNGCDNAQVYTGSYQVCRSKPCLLRLPFMLLAYVPLWMTHLGLHCPAGCMGGVIDDHEDGAPVAMPIGHAVQEAQGLKVQGLHIAAWSLCAGRRQGCGDGKLDAGPQLRLQFLCWPCFAACLIH